MEKKYYGVIQRQTEKDFNMVRKALDMGAASLRLGFEDSDYLETEYGVKPMPSL